MKMDFPGLWAAALLIGSVAPFDAAAEVASFRHALLMGLEESGDEEGGQHADQAHAETQDAERVGAETPGDEDRREEAEAAGGPGAGEEHDGFPAEIALVGHGVDSIRKRVAHAPRCP